MTQEDEAEGKYDGLATLVRETANAHMVMVVVVGGNKGNGFSVQAVDRKLIADVPALLEHIAKDIRRQAPKGESVSE